MKQVFKWILQGAAVAVGGLIVNRVAASMDDPVKKATVKRKFSRVMNAFNED